MAKVKIKCSFCGKTYFRESGRFNEAKKFDWNQYCSGKCQNKAHLKGSEEICANPDCRNKFYRALSQTKKSVSNRFFCSRSCAAIINNATKKKIKKCPVCKGLFHGRNKYCSKLCRSKAENPNKKSDSEKRKTILNKIKGFYNDYGRIPTKKEKPGLAWGSQIVFGTWNKAIEAAGFEPNPVMFSKKFVAKDGHKCDSFAEKIVDDWLSSQKIKHKRNVPYPDSEYTADFQIGKNFIEFLGLCGELKEYDKNVSLKKKLAKNNNIKLITVYPKDLFPVNHLSKIIKSN